MKNKRVLMMIMVALLVMFSVMPSFAADDFSAQFVPPQQGAGVLYIDGEYKYAGMETSYSMGYAPSVEGDAASVVLPLITGTNTSGIKEDTVYLSVYLGKVKESPFLFKNYDKNVKWSAQNVTDASGTAQTRNAFLANFNLQLEPASNRTIGKYPVVFSVRYSLLDGTKVTQNFMVYITIDEGNDPASPTPAPTDDNGSGEQQPGGDSGAPEPGGGGAGGGGGGASTSQPKVFISNYTVFPETVYAGELFTVNVRLRNASKKSSVKNIAVTYKNESGDMIPGEGTNTAYLEKINKDSVGEFSFSMEARADAKPGPQKITVSIGYEDAQGAQLTATDEVTVQVRQKIRLEYDKPQVASQYFMGDSFNLNLNLYNKGKNTLYNVTAVLDVPGLLPDSSAFLGNMESGTAKTADFYGSVVNGSFAGSNSGESVGTDGGTAIAPREDKEVMVAPMSADIGIIGGADGPTQIIVDNNGDKPMILEEAPKETEGEEGSEEAPTPGAVEGSILVTYEDEYGDEYELAIPISTKLVEMPDYGGGTDEVVPEQPSPGGFPWWGIVLIGVAAVVVVVVIVRARNKKKRAIELAEDMEDDDIL